MALTLKDLSKLETLDRQALCAIRGANGSGAVWMTDAFQWPAGAASFLQIANNFFSIDQRSNQGQTVQLNNTGANASMNAVLLGSFSQSR